MSCLTFSKVTTSPRVGMSGTPPRVVSLPLPVDSDFSPRLAKSDKTRPAVCLSRAAISLAAWRTSASISSVVLTHQMFTHHNGLVNVGVVVAVL